MCRGRVPGTRGRVRPARRDGRAAAVGSAVRRHGTGEHRRHVAARWREDPETAVGLVHELAAGGESGDGRGGRRSGAVRTPPRSATTAGAVPVSPGGGPYGRSSHERLLGEPGQAVVEPPEVRGAAGVPTVCHPDVLGPAAYVGGVRDPARLGSGWGVGGHQVADRPACAFRSFRDGRGAAWASRGCMPGGRGRGGGAGRVPVASRAGTSRTGTWAKAPATRRSAGMVSSLRARRRTSRTGCRGLGSPSRSSPVSAQREGARSGTGRRFRELARLPGRGALTLLPRPHGPHRPPV